MHRENLSLAVVFLYSEDPVGQWFITYFQAIFGYKNDT